MIIFGYLKLTALYKLKRKGIKAIGEIENIINPESNILSELSYVPEVKFNIKNLEIIGVPKNSIRSNPTFYKKGRKYLIYYMSKVQKVCASVQLVDRWLCGSAAAFM